MKTKVYDKWTASVNFSLVSQKEQLSRDRDFSFGLIWSSQTRCLTSVN